MRYEKSNYTGVQMTFRYLVIEDAGFVRELIKGVCNSIGGVCVGECEDGLHALDLVRQTLPDLIVWDLVLPGQNGVVLAADLRKTWPEAKIIACTSLTDTAIHRKAVENGVDAIVEKPFTLEKLSEVLKNQISNRNEVAT
jgi:two-component system, chemotaxis family, chemotaxis protein CheY